MYIEIIQVRSYETGSARQVVPPKFVVNKQLHNSINNELNIYIYIYTHMYVCVYVYVYVYICILMYIYI